MRGPEIAPSPLPPISDSKYVRPAGNPARPVDRPKIPTNTFTTADRHPSISIGPRAGSIHSFLSIPFPFPTITSSGRGGETMPSQQTPALRVSPDHLQGFVTAAPSSTGHSRKEKFSAGGQILAPAPSVSMTSSRRNHALEVAPVSPHFDLLRARGPHVLRDPQTSTLGMDDGLTSYCAHHLTLS